MDVIRGLELRDRGYGGIWGVGKAAVNQPALAILSYIPEGASQTVRKWKDSVKLSKCHRWPAGVSCRQGCHVRYRWPVLKDFREHGAMGSTRIEYDASNRLG
eukprot:764046-Hanusia_phi.AAC.4